MGKGRGTWSGERPMSLVKQPPMHDVMGDSVASIAAESCVGGCVATDMRRSRHRCLRPFPPCTHCSVCCRCMVGHNLHWQCRLLRSASNAFNSCNEPAGISAMLAKAITAATAAEVRIC